MSVRTRLAVLVMLGAAVLVACGGSDVGGAGDSIGAEGESMDV